jgi:hypothetical protein
MEFNTLDIIGKFIFVPTFRAGWLIRKEESNSFSFEIVFSMEKNGEDGPAVPSLIKQSDDM